MRAPQKGHGNENGDHDMQQRSRPTENNEHDEMYFCFSIELLIDIIHVLYSYSDIAQADYIEHYKAKASYGLKDRFIDFLMFNKSNFRMSSYHGLMLRHTLVAMAGITVYCTRYIKFARYL